MIVGVAVRNDVVQISLPAPKRHSDCFRYLDEQFGEEKANELAKDMHGVNQGFITDQGIYLNRKEAMQHVWDCKQTLIPREGIVHKRNGYLFSEDLW